MATRGVNKVIIVGNLGQDPEVKYMPSGQAVCNITVATSESWNDKNTGEKKEVTEWHRIVLFGKIAEVCGEYCRKGSQVYVEGSLKTRKWTDQAGVEKYSTEIHLGFNGSFQMLGGKTQPGNSTAAGTAWGQPQQPSGPAQSGPRSGGNRQQRQPQQNAPQNGNNEPPMDFDDDIPF